MQNYSQGIPTGSNGNPHFLSPPNRVALEQYVSENGTASSVLTLTQDTNAIEVAAGGAGAVLRWVTTADTEGSVVAIAGSTANYDHAVPANTFRRFVVPVESMPATGYGSLMGSNRANGLYRRVAIKSQGVGSVLLSEYQ